MIVVFIILGIVFLLTFKIFLRINSEVRKIYNIKKAPVFSKFTEVFGGSAIVKAFGVKEDVLNDFERRMDEMINCKCHEKYSEFSVFYQMDLTGVLIIYLTAISFALFRIVNFDVFVNADTIAISLSNVIILSNWFAYNMFPVAAIVKGLTSVEKMI